MRWVVSAGVFGGCYKNIFLKKAEYAVQQDRSPRQPWDRGARPTRAQTSETCNPKNLQLGAKQQGQTKTQNHRGTIQTLLWPLVTMAKTGHDDAPDDPTPSHETQGLQGRRVV